MYLNLVVNITSNECDKMGSVFYLCNTIPMQYLTLQGKQVLPEKQLTISESKWTSWQGMVADACNSNTLRGQSGQITWGGSSRPASQTRRNPISTKNTKMTQAWWCMPVIPAIGEDVARQSLTPGRRWVSWAKITSFLCPTVYVKMQIHWTRLNCIQWKADQKIQKNATFIYFWPRTTPHPAFLLLVVPPHWNKWL